MTVGTFNLNNLFSRAGALRAVRHVCLPTIDEERGRLGCQPPQSRLAPFAMSIDFDARETTTSAHRPCRD